MIDQLNQAIAEYRQKWEKLMEGRADRQFFAECRPISVGWKIADLAAYDKLYAELREYCDQTHAISKNDRWLATMHLKDTKLEWGIEVVNLMQLRPGSEDVLGLDNINFLCPRYAEADDILAREPSLKWTHESNGPYSEWISLWFDSTEAKLRPITIIDVSLAEYKEVRDKVAGS